MITFPTMVETFVACNGEAVAGLDVTTIKLLNYCVNIFSGAFYAGTKGEAPINIIKDAVENYARVGMQQDFENPKIKCFYASLQHMCDKTWRQGAARTERKEVQA